MSDSGRFVRVTDGEARVCKSEKKCQAEFQRRPENAQENEPERDERGSVEAGLTLIPLTTLFLLLIQLVVAGQWQTSESFFLHDLVIRSQVLEGGIPDIASDGGRSEKRKLIVEDEYVDGVGVLKKYELRSSIPLLGPFFDWSGGEVFIRNFVMGLE